jgi:hypothetical protein
MKPNSIGLNVYQIKILALVFMTIDHIAVYLGGIPLIGSAYELLRVLGRISAPLFLFAVVQGLRHTKNRRKYIFRLYLASVAVQIGNIMLERFMPNTAYSLGNILPLFVYTALFITLIESLTIHFKNKEYIKSFRTMLIIAIPFVTTHIDWSLVLEKQWDILLVTRVIAPPLHGLEYSLLFVLLGILWYFANSKAITCILLGILSIAGYAVDANFIIHLSGLLPWTINFWELFLHTQWCMILAIPFILLYNNEKGRGSKYFFYVYYPLHQYLLYILAI